MGLGKAIMTLWANLSIDTKESVDSLDKVKKKSKETSVDINEAFTKVVEGAANIGNATVDAASKLIENANAMDENSEEALKLEKATENVATALDNASKVAEDSTIDSKKLAKAQMELANAELAVQKAKNNLAKAEIDYQRAVEKTGESSATAQKALLNVKNAQLAVHEASNKASVAQENYNDTLNSLEDEAKDASKGVDKLDNSFKETEKSGSKFGDTLTKIIGGAAKVGTAVIGAASTLAAGAYAMVDSVAQQADEIDKLSERTGISTGELQRWKHAAEMSGAEASAFEEGAKAMSAALAEALDAANAGEMSETAEFLEKLGLSFRDIEKMSVDDRFNAITTALAEMDAGIERDAIGNKLLGESYNQLLPLLNSGADAIKALKNEADDLGIVMSEDAIDAGVKFGDTVTKIKSSLNGAKNTPGGSLVPILQKFADLILKGIPKVHALITRATPSVERLFEQILPPLFILLETLFPGIMDTVETLLPSLEVIMTVLLPVFVELLQKLLPSATTIIQKLLPVLVQLLQLIAPLLGPLLSLLDPILNLVIKLIDPLLDVTDALYPIIEILTHLIEWILPKLQTGLSEEMDSLFEKFSMMLDHITQKIEAAKIIFQNIIEFFKNVFAGDWEAAWQNVKNIFVEIWNSLVSGIKLPINMIIENVNRLIGGLNKIQFDIPDWLGGGEFGINIKEIPKLRRGIDYVPQDDYPALLHRGEQVLTAAEKKEYDAIKEERQNGGKTVPKIDVKVDVHIERFENRGDDDLDALVEKIIILIMQKIKQKGAVFA